MQRDFNSAALYQPAVVREPINEHDVEGRRFIDADTGREFVLVKAGMATGWGARWVGDPDDKKPLPIARARFLRAIPVEERP